MRFVTFGSVCANSSLARSSDRSIVGAHVEQTATVAFANPAIYVSDTTGCAIGMKFSALTTGSGVGISIATDTGFIAKDNVLGGYTIALPIGALTNTIVDANLGCVGSNKEQFSGYFNSAAAVSRLPSGWTVSRTSAGYYSIAHNLALNEVYDVIFTVSPGTLGGYSAAFSLPDSNTNAARIKTYLGTTLTDCDVLFTAKRRRS